MSHDVDAEINASSAMEDAIHRGYETEIRKGL